MMRTDSQRQESQMHIMKSRIRAYSMIIATSLSIVVPMALLYYFDAPSFDKTWKGRTFYLFFVWLFAMILILDWEKYGSETENRRFSSGRSAALGIALTLPARYVISEYVLGLNRMISDWGIQNGIALARDFPTIVPLSVEYLVFSAYFAMIFLLAYGLNGLKDFSVSFSLLALVGIIYGIDNAYPQGTFTPFQILVPTTTKLAAWFLNLMGYSTSIGFGMGMTMLRASSAHGGWGAYIAWPCSGIESLLIYTVTIVLFLRKSPIRWWQKALCFVIGAVITYMINALRIVTIFLIGLSGGDIQPFHDYYGPLYSIIWITSYPLIIIGVQAIWKKIRATRTALQGTSLSPDDSEIVSSF